MQRRSKCLELEKVNPEIKKIYKKNRKEKKGKVKRIAEPAAQARALEEYRVPSLTRS